MITEKDMKIKESTEKLLKKMNDDKVFAEKILTQTEKEKVIELAGAEEIDITLEDIDEANEIIQRTLELYQTEGELSEEELENVAGGIGTFLGTLLSMLILGGALSAVITSMGVTTVSVATVSVAYSIDESNKG